MPSSGRASVGLSAVIISVDETTPRLLTVHRGAEGLGLPSTHLDDRIDRTLQQGVRRLVSSETGLPVRYFEQLYTFGDRGRAPGGRELAVAYLALARYQARAWPERAELAQLLRAFPVGRLAVGETGAARRGHPAGHRRVVGRVEPRRVAHQAGAGRADLRRRPGSLGPGPGAGPLRAGLRARDRG